MRTLSWRTIGLLGVLVVVVVVGGILSTTRHPGPVDAVGICQDTATARRVPDQQCAAGQLGARWVYYATGSTAPALGGPVRGGSLVPPSGGASVSTGGEPDSGGEIGGTSGSGPGSGVGGGSPEGGLGGAGGGGGGDE